MRVQSHRKDDIILLTLAHLDAHRKLSDGMFLRACRELAPEFPDVKYDEDLLDRVCLRVVQDPTPYADRVMVMPNVSSRPTGLELRSRDTDLVSSELNSFTVTFSPICGMLPFSSSLQSIPFD